MQTTRLDKLLAGMGYGSRREVESLMDQDRVLLDGKPILDCGMKVELSEELRARLSIDGEGIDPLPGMVVMLHKPVGVTCSHKESGPLVYDLFPPRWKRRDPQLSSVGRLDKETSGLLLFTDDGKFLHRIISPKHHVPKCYLATLAKPSREDAAAIFSRGGLILEGEAKPLLPAELEVIAPTIARLTIHEGRYHQVRRMFAALENRVVELHRESVGGLKLPNELKPGDYRLLSPYEINQLFAN